MLNLTIYHHHNLNHQGLLLPCYRRTILISSDSSCNLKYDMNVVLQIQLYKRVVFIIHIYSWLGSNRNG